MEVRCVVIQASFGMPVCKSQLRALGMLSGPLSLLPHL